MFIQHPLEFIPQKARSRLFYLFIGLTAAGFLIFQFLDQPLRTLAAPSGIVSFELAGSIDNAKAMMESWNQAALLNNAFGLGFDFLFMPVYATALSLGILLAVYRRTGFWPNIGKILGWVAYIAIGFDSIENVALFAILHGNNVMPVPQVAFWCASIKFGIIIIGSFYGLIGWLFPERHV